MHCGLCAPGLCDTENTWTAASHRRKPYYYCLLFYFSAVRRGGRESQVAGRGPNVLFLVGPVAAALDSQCWTVCPSRRVDDVLLVVVPEAVLPRSEMQSGTCHAYFWANKV